MRAVQSRRDFLSGLSATGAVGLLPGRGSLADEAPEVTTVRLSKIPGICIAPQYAAEELLRAEGFTDVRYVETAPGLGPSESVVRGDLDFALNFAPLVVIPMETSQDRKSVV